MKKSEESSDALLRPVERHPLKPFFPTGAEILVLGSFPPPRVRWRMEFFYPNFQNDFWRIMGLVYFRDADRFIENQDGEKRFDLAGIKQFLTERRIALYDAAVAVVRERGDASDRFLTVMEPLDLAATLRRLPECRKIILTGQKAAETIIPQLFAERLTKGERKDYNVPKPGESRTWNFDGREIRIHRVCSPSRAYPLPPKKKAVIYHHAFIGDPSDRTTTTDQENRKSKKG